MNSDTTWIPPWCNLMVVTHLLFEQGNEFEQILIGLLLSDESFPANAYWGEMQRLVQAAQNAIADQYESDHIKDIVRELHVECRLSSYSELIQNRRTHLADQRDQGDDADTLSTLARRVVSEIRNDLLDWVSAQAIKPLINDLLRKAKTRVGSLDLAFDLVQEAVSDFWCRVRHRNIDLDDNPPGLFARIVERRVQDYFRKEYKFREKFDEYAVATEEIDESQSSFVDEPWVILAKREDEKRLFKALQLLGDKDRRIIAMKDLKNQSYNDIAREFGVSVRNAYTIHYRAMNRLRSYFDNRRSDE